jgi:hypothetical protein
VLRLKACATTPISPQVRLGVMTSQGPAHAGKIPPLHTGWEQNACRHGDPPSRQAVKTRGQAGGEEAGPWESPGTSPQLSILFSASSCWRHGKQACPSARRPAHPELSVTRPCLSPCLRCRHRCVIIVSSSSSSELPRCPEACRAVTSSCGRRDFRWRTSRSGIPYASRVITRGQRWGSWELPGTRGPRWLTNTSAVFRGGGDTSGGGAMSTLRALRAVLCVYAVGIAVALAQLLRRLRGDFRPPGECVGSRRGRGWCAVARGRRIAREKRHTGTAGSSPDSRRMPTLTDVPLVLWHPAVGGANAETKTGTANV